MKGSASLSILTWAFGGFLTIALAATGANSITNNAQDKLLTEHEGKLSGVTAEVRSNTARMDRIETKLDWLIQHQGGNPQLITQLSQASSSQVRK